MKKWPILCFFLLSGLFADAQKWQFGTDLFSKRKVFLKRTGFEPYFFEKYQPVRGDLMVNYLLKKNWALRAKIDPLERWMDEFVVAGRFSDAETVLKNEYRGQRASFGVEKGWKFGRFKPLILADFEIVVGKTDSRTRIVAELGEFPLGSFAQTSKKFNEYIGLGLEFYLSKRVSLRAESAFQNSFGWTHLTDGAGEHDFRERSFKFWWLNSFGAFVRF